MQFTIDGNIVFVSSGMMDGQGNVSLFMVCTSMFIHAAKRTSEIRGHFAQKRVHLQGVSMMFIFVFFG
ncbi:hypothetical protein Pint_03572 [Pistacia integerrima]|uniref:Uncharacterized protein n=1 Tax=Pistacia integerrima TaxID=434235 RepID=A0ACC0ZJD7_9ROSI|nr:hypothetical protein Pint_03572 [Pistacia integerrima]